MVTIEHQDGELRYDALAIVNSRRLAVEFCVHHGVNDEKVQKLEARGLSCVEIELDPDDARLSTLDGLEEAVRRTAPRKWITQSPKLKAAIDSGRIAHERDPETIREVKTDKMFGELEDLILKISRKFPFGSSTKQAAEAIQELRHVRCDLEMAMSDREIRVAEQRYRRAKEFGWATMKLPK